MKLMFGDIDAPDFINAMFSNAHINSETAADILLEVDMKILKKIRQTLEEVEEAEKNEEEIDNFLLEDEEKEAREENEKYAEYYEEIARIRAEDDAAPEDEFEEEIPTNTAKEKDDLLAEINTPTKSFTNIITSEPTLIPVDHQIENIHIEEPYHQVEIKKVETIPDIQPVPPKAETPTTIPPTPPVSEIKKPININLNDIYREPIE
jgi:hypothetical protein